MEENEMEELVLRTIFERCKKEYWKYPFSFRRTMDEFFEDHFPRFETLEDIAGLRVRPNVTVATSSLLRFQFLFQECLPGRERNVFENSQGREGNFLPYWYRFVREEMDCGDLIQIEGRYDSLRDRLDQSLVEIQSSIDRLPIERREEWESWLRNLRRGVWEAEFFPSEEMPSSLREAVNGIRRILRGEEGEGGLIGLQRQLNNASIQLQRRLGEEGISCRHIYIDGVLGEYSFSTRQILLYPEMIKIVLPSILQHFPGRRLSQEELYELLTCVIEIHESAHALFHLGNDTTQETWKAPQKASTPLHETIAQYYAWEQIKIIDSQTSSNDIFKHVFEALNRHQPYYYSLFQTLENMDREEVRRFFLRQRKNEHFPIALDQLLQQSFQVLKDSQESLDIERVKKIEGYLKKIFESKAFWVEEFVELWNYLSSETFISHLLTHGLQRELPNETMIRELCLEYFFRQGKEVGNSPRASITGAQAVETWPKLPLSANWQNHPVFIWPRDILNRAIAKLPFLPETVLVPGIELDFSERTCTLKDFSIGKYAVTAMQWTEFLNKVANNSVFISIYCNLNEDSTYCNFRGEYQPKAGLENYPANNVSLVGARAYCQWLKEVTGKNCKIPKEEQWLLAYNNLSCQRFPWRKGITKNQANYMKTWKSPKETLVPVDSFPDGCSSFGCYQMVGNVWEWTETEEQGKFVLKGGCYNTTLKEISFSGKISDAEKAKSPEYGFRIVVES